MHNDSIISTFLHIWEELDTFYLSSSYSREGLSIWAFPIILMFLSWLTGRGCYKCQPWKWVKFQKMGYLLLFLLEDVQRNKLAYLKFTLSNSLKFVDLQHTYVDHRKIASQNQTHRLKNWHNWDELSEGENANTTQRFKMTYFCPLGVYKQY